MSNGDDTCDHMHLLLLKDVKFPKISQFIIFKNMCFYKILWLGKDEDIENWNLKDVPMRTHDQWLASGVFWSQRNMCFETCEWKLVKKCISGKVIGLDITTCSFVCRTLAEVIHKP